MVYREQIAKKNMIDFEEILTLTFLFLPTSFSIDLKSLPKAQSSWQMGYSGMVAGNQKCNQGVSKES